MPVKFALYSCNEDAYPSIKGFWNHQLTPYIGEKIILNSDASKVYTVARYVLASFFQLEPCPDVTTWTVSSVKYNGVEQLTGTEIYSVDKAANPSVWFQLQDFEFHLFRDLGVFTLSSQGGTEIEVQYAGFMLFLKNLIETDLGLPIRVSQSWTDYMYNTEFVNLNGEEFSGTPYGGIIFEKEEKDSIEITFSYNNPNTTPCFTNADEHNNEVFVWTFDGVDANITVDGDVPDFGVVPLYSWDYESFGITAVENGIPTVVDSCDLQVPSFNTDVEFDCVTCETECDALSFTDTSTINNTFPGHQVFGYRLIRLIRPDGTAYEYSSVSSDDPDQLIGVLSNGGINTFSYSFLDTDTDGVWSVQVYNFPEWDEDVLYNHLLGIIVHKGDKIYQCIQSNVGVDPETDVDGAYWVEYAITEDTLNTRYGSVAFKAVLCISLIGCYKKLVEDAFCSEKSGPCSNLCDNQKFQNAMKIRVVWDAIKSSSCRNDWDEVKNQIDIWKNLCSCVNC